MSRSSVRRQIRESNCSRLFVGIVRHDRRDSRGGCSVDIHTKRSVLIVIIEGNFQVVCNAVTSSIRDGVLDIFNLRLRRGCERRHMIGLAFILYAFEIHFVGMCRGCLPVIREGLFFLRVRSRRLDRVFLAVPVLDNQILSLTIDKLYLHLHLILRLFTTAFIGLNGCRSRSDLRTIRSLERHIEFLTVVGIVKAEIIRMRLAISNQTVYLNRVFGGCHLRLVIIGL